MVPVAQRSPQAITRIKEDGMDRRRLFTAGGAAVLAAAAGKSAIADGAGEQGIVGSYFGTITAVNPPLGSFNDVISFHEGGVVTESRRYFVPATPFGPLLETTGHGAWKRTGNRTYEAFFRFLLQQAPPSGGEPVGTDNIHLSVKLSRSGKLTGTFESNIKDNTDTVIFTATGDFTAEPITV
jgi:hypothetical protein